MSVSSKRSLVYAIDFGTTNSLVAAAEPGKIHSPIPLDSFAKDPTILRSLLYFPSMSQLFYGAEAILKFSDGQGAGRLIRSIKKQLPCRTFIGTWIEDRPVNLEDLIGFFLAELRRRANKHFDCDVDSVILGRPARFSADDADDKFAQFRLEQAAQRAGFKHIEFCPEPVAAAHGFKTQLKEEKIVCVGDFGGGTSDFTVMKIGPKDYDVSDVLAIGGVAVAGDAFDGSVMRHDLSKHFGAGVKYKVPFGSNILSMPIHVMEKLCSPADIGFLAKREMKDFLQLVSERVIDSEDSKKLRRLLLLVEEQLGFYVFEQIEGAKRRLSEVEKTALNLDHPGIEVETEISRNDFEKFSAPQVSAITASLDETLKQAGVAPKDIDVVCCTGGTARVAALQRELVQRFGPEKLFQHNYFHSVVEGLAKTASEKFK